jgi:CheY-like chemotaxis protein
MSGLHRLASGLAHELNNPLTALIGHAQFLQLAQSDEKVRQRAEIIVQEAERMAAILRRLVAFARPRRSEHRPLAINAVIEEAVHACRPALEERKIRPTLRLAAGLPPVLGDPEQLAQVFLSLVQNAQEAIASTGAEGEVRITSAASVPAGRLQIAVEDTGPGIPQGNLGKIFDPFFSTRRTGEGAGLGLTLCCLILKEHDGRIRAGNRPEGGARLEIDLPAHLPGRTGDNTPSAPDPPVRAADGARRILVVDDQEAVARFVSSALQMDGHLVDVALGGAPASALLAEREYDLVLMDFNMPEMRGDRLYREAAALRAPGRRVAIMTADTRGEEAAAFLAATGLPVLEKPFTIEALRGFVRRLLPPATPGTAASLPGSAPVAD